MCWRHLVHYRRILESGGAWTPATRRLRRFSQARGRRRQAVPNLLPVLLPVLEQSDLYVASSVQNPLPDCMLRLLRRESIVVDAVLQRFQQRLVVVFQPSSTNIYGVRETKRERGRNGKGQRGGKGGRENHTQTVPNPSRIERK